MVVVADSTAEEDSPAGDPMVEDSPAAAIMAEDFPLAAIAVVTAADVAVTAVGAVTAACAEVQDSRAALAREEPGRRRAAPAFVTPHPDGIRSQEAAPVQELLAEDSEPAGLLRLAQGPTASGTPSEARAALPARPVDRQSPPAPSTGQASTAATLSDTAAIGAVAAGAVGAGVADGAGAVGVGDSVSDSAGALIGMARRTGIAHGGATTILPLTMFTRTPTSLRKSWL